MKLLVLVGQGQVARAVGSSAPVDHSVSVKNRQFVHTYLRSRAHELGLGHQARLDYQVRDHVCP